MSSISHRLATMAIALAGFAAVAPAHADVLVVRSSGQSADAFPPGRRLADNASVTLGRNDTLTVLGPAGTRVLRGPGTFSVTGPTQMSPLAREMTNRSRRTRSRIGAVRGSGDARGLWQWDVTRTGPFCIAAEAPPILWRPDAREAASLAVDSTTIEWPAGRASVRWPDSVPIVAGSEYRLWLSSQSSPTTMRLIRLPRPPADPIDLAERFIQNGCQSQLEWLLETIPAV